MINNSNLRLIEKVSIGYYDNTINPFIPEIWAQESLAILEENMIAGALVHRDFENEFARYGELVHTRRLAA